MNKFERLGVYGKLILHDNNNLPFPFESETLQTVFSNTIYWVSGMNQVLADIARMLHPGGKLVLQLPTPCFLTTLDKLETFMGPDAVSILDRQRRATMPSCVAPSEWVSIVEKLGLKLDRVASVFPHEPLIDYWNVGMRPVAHLLYQMANEISPERRLEIKTKWVDIMFELLKPIVSLPNTCALDKSPYVLVEATK